MEIMGEPPPLWPQLTNSMPRRRSPSPLFSPPVLIILLPIIVLLLLFFAVPPFLSVTSQIFRPIGVRKSWDSLNIFLVLFAIICGVLARRTDDDDKNTTINVRNDSNIDKPSHPAVSQQWFEFPERKIYDEPLISETSSATSVRRLKRSSSSYPDLRQDSLWENSEDRFRFFDDFEINKYRFSTNYNDRVYGLRGSLRSEFQESEAKVIHVDTFVLRSSTSSPTSKSPAPSTPPPPPPPPPAARHKSRRTYQAVRQKEIKVTSQNDHDEFSKSPQPGTPPPPPPPPRRPPSPLVQTGNRSEQKYAKLERRKSNAPKEIKMVFAALRKRKKKQKSKDPNYQQVCPLQSPLDSPPYDSNTIPPPSPPPPPPPPPPPSSVFQKYNLFRKGSKTKKFHSVPTPPPPPPPPAFSFSKRSSKQTSQIPPTPPPAPPPAFLSTKRFMKQKSQIPPPRKPAPAPPTPAPEPSRRRTMANIGRPPLPTKANTSYYDENMNSGGQSPVIPMPPGPPPPPPFKMPEFKFVVRGDFVKIRSSPSSRCSSPDLDEVDVSPSKDDADTVSLTDGDDAVRVGLEGVRVFCPSPDVDAKADTFIAKLKDGWKLEKMNSMKEKQRI